MGSYAPEPSDGGTPSDDADEPAGKLGEVLSGRLADVEVDSVEAVRDIRESR